MAVFFWTEFSKPLLFLVSEGVTVAGLITMHLTDYCFSLIFKVSSVCFLFPFFLCLFLDYSFFELLLFLCFSLLRIFLHLRISKIYIDIIYIVYVAKKYHIVSISLHLAQLPFRILLTNLFFWFISLGKSLQFLLQIFIFFVSLIRQYNT